MWIPYSLLVIVTVGNIWGVTGAGPIPRQVIQNREVTLQCMLPMEESKGVNVYWYNKKDGWLSSGNAVRKHDRVLKINKPAPNEWNLVIKRAHLSFQDIYTCKTNTNTFIISFNLTILTPPRINESASSLKDISVLEGGSVVLTCAVSGNPIPVIDWYKGVSETPIGIFGHVLRIPDVTRYAADEYMCRAKSHGPNAERIFRLTVKFAPQAEVMNKVVYAEVGEVTVLSCVVQASPLMDAFWLNENGDRIQEKRKYRLLQENAGDDIPAKFLTLIFLKSMLDNEDFGNYTCMVTGINSEARAVVTLKKKAGL
ncbi:opioid-binding protein/cell adhesion molecule-like isoform X2 [Ruditapes philippinarum]|uniref:opioid-binding protein/cell adhesion molecule-like isoform X2 n=1 Tax=Ruditapes philippinarum TaxID=129788 RepID=UPI00295C21E6|nr:opioid-binding protein/cell adhesion molecule-like isoform X2 [Ruditapes philippinarum]